MAADGSIVIDVLLDDGSVAKGVADIGKEFDGLDKSGTSKLKSLGSGFKTLASVAAVGATAVVGVGAAIGGLAAPLVQAAAGAQAMTAQFGQVFGDLQKQAQSTINTLGENFGMMPDRIKPAFTQMTSMFKGLGLDTNTAMAEAEKAVTAVADAAAFYDMSFNDANAALNSFIKGNYEGGEAIGLFANETQMASYAMKEGLIGATKEWASLDEATKQATRLEYALAMQNMAGATGQATRESDSLENQLGNLNQAWENLKALLGAPLLEPAIQGIKFLTEIIKNFDAAPFIAAFEMAISNVSTAIDAIKNFVQSGLSTVKSYFEENGTSIKDTVQIAFDNAKSIIESVLNAVVPFVQNQLDKVKQFWSDNGEQIMQAAKTAFEGVKAIIDFVMPAIQIVIEYVWNAIKNVITGAIDVIMGLVKTFSSLLTGDFKGMWEGIKQIFSGAIDLIMGLMSLSFVGGIRTLVTNLAKTFVNAIKTKWTSVVNLFKNGANSVASTISSWVGKLIGFVKNLATNFTTTITTLRTSVVTRFKELSTQVINAVKDLPGKFLQIGKDIVNGMIKGIKGLTENAINAITGVVDGVVNAAKDFLGIASPSKVFTQIGKWTGLGLVEGIDGTQSAVKKSIEELSGILIDVAENNIQQEKEIRKKADAEILKLRKDTANKISTLEKSSNNKILSIQDSASKKKKGMTASQQRALVNTRTETAAKILKIEEDTAAKIAKIDAKAKSDAAKLISTNQKEVLEEIKLFISDKQSLEQMNLIQEAAIWEKSISLFEEGTKERIEAQKAYQKSIETINSEIVSTNNKYISAMQKIDDDFVKQSEEKTKKYEDTLSAREKALFSFTDLFSLFDATIEQSGADLLNNLNSQVDGFKEWQTEIEKLSEKAIDDGLIAELETMGPKALGEIKALNSLSESELQKYSDLYKEKAALARSQAEKELVPMKRDTEKHINDLRKIADAELSKLEKEWTKEIKAITNGTANELKSLESIGKDAVRGLISGMESMHEDLRAKAKAIGETVSKATADALKVKSPSRVMMEIGKWSVAGLVKGLENNEGEVKTASKSLADTIIDAFNTGTSLNPDDFVDNQLKSLVELQNQIVAIESKTANSRTSIQEDFIKKRTELDAKYAHVFEAREKELQRIKDGTSEENFRLHADEINRYLMILFGNDINEHGNAATKLYDEERAALEAYDKELAERFALEKKFIEESKKLNLLSLTDELDMYEKFAQMYAEDSEQRKYYEQQAVAVRQTINDTLLSLNEEYTKKIQQANKDLAEGTLKIEEDAAKERLKINENANDQLIKNEEDYIERVTNLKETLADQEKSVIEDRKQALYDFAGIFDKVGKKEGVTGKRLMLAMQSQVDTFKKWQSNLNNLSKKGIDAELLADLEAMGPAAATEIAALNSLSASELKEYGTLWREKSSLVTKQVNNELGDMNSNTAKQIKQMRSDTAIQLAQYEADFHATNASIRLDQETQLETLRLETEEQLSTLRSETAIQLDLYAQEWQQAISSIKEGTTDNFNTLVEDMPTIGQNVIEGMMRGLEDMTPSLLAQTRAIAESIKATIEAALDIHSPSRWARKFVMGNLAKGFSLGADDNKNMIIDAADRMAEWLKPDVSITNPFRGFKPAIAGLTTPSSISNTSSSIHTDRSQNISATFNVGTGNNAADLKRAWREMTFKMGV